MNIIQYTAPKPPKGGSKMQNGGYSYLKSHLAWRRSATNFFVCENCQQQSCKAFAPTNNIPVTYGALQVLYCIALVYVSVQNWFKTVWDRMSVTYY